MFFLPLPLSETVETLGRIGSLTGTTTSASKTEEILPSPELYIMVNGKVTKSKVVWWSNVDVNALTAALHTLKRVNVFYRNVSDASEDEAMKQVIDSTTSSMPFKMQRQGSLLSFRKGRQY